MTSAPLYEYSAHPTAHAPRDINSIHRARRNYNQRVAKTFMALLTAMPVFWVVLLLCSSWIVLNDVKIWRFDLPPFALLSTFVSVLELPLMLIITIGQELDFRHQELVTEEQYNTAVKTEHDLAQLVNHLASQDHELVRQSALLVQIVQQDEQVLRELHEVRQLVEQLMHPGNKKGISANTNSARTR